MKATKVYVELRGTLVEDGVLKKSKKKEATIEFDVQVLVNSKENKYILNHCVLPVSKSITTAPYLKKDVMVYIFGTYQSHYYNSDNMKIQSILVRSASLLDKPTETS